MIYWITRHHKYNEMRMLYIYIYTTKPVHWLNNYFLVKNKLCILYHEQYISLLLLNADHNLCCFSDEYNDMPLKCQFRLHLFSAMNTLSFNFHHQAWIKHHLKQRNYSRLKTQPSGNLYIHRLWLEFYIDT